MLAMLSFMGARHQPRQRTPENGVKEPQQYCFEWMQLLKQYWEIQCDKQNEIPDNKP